MTKKEEQKALALRKAGKSIRAIAKEIHRDDSAISAFLKSKGDKVLVKQSAPAKKAVAKKQVKAKPQKKAAPAKLVSVKKPVKKTEACKLNSTIKAKDAADKSVSVKSPIIGTDYIRIKVPTFKKEDLPVKEDPSVTVNITIDDKLIPECKIPVLQTFLNEVTGMIFEYVQILISEDCCGKKPTAKLNTKPSKK